MRPLLNTLYITTQGAWVGREGETVSVRLENETKVRVPIHTLQAIICFGQVTCTSWLMGFAAESGVPVSFLSEHGRFLARVQGPVSGNVLLRREQFLAAESPTSKAALARSVVLGKIANCRTVLQRAARERQLCPEKSELEAAILRLGRLQGEVRSIGDVDGIRGFEGEAARVYFSVFDHLIGRDRQAFFFRGRSRRPPTDNVNAMLSFAYTLLTADVAGALEGVGLDPAVGYLHALRPGRPSLALDLVEELRPALADRFVLSLINRQQVVPADFKKTETGGVTMGDEARKTFLAAWQRRKQEEVEHPFLGEKVPIGLIPHLQATLLARALRGDLDGYPCYFWR